MATIKDLGISSKEFYEFKKQLSALKKYRGRGTELISVYVTPKYPISEISGKLRDEYGQASNIKSSSTRNNVQTALDKILGYLKLFKETPKYGMAIFCGNVSETEGKADVQLFPLFPPVPLPVQFYRCESSFVLDPLTELVESTSTYGVVVMDGKEATVALLKGKTIKVLKQIHSTAHSKTSKGGQCLHEKSLVQMADGQIKEIREVKPGEKVLSFNWQEQIFQESECTDVFARNDSEAFVIRTKMPTTQIIATKEHRFFCAGENGVAEKFAQELEKGDLLLLPAYLRTKQIAAPLIQPKIQIEVTAKGRALLTSARKALGQTQMQVAVSIGNSQMMISRLEKGKSHGMEKLPELLRHYGINDEFYQYVECRGAALPSAITPTLAQFLGYLIGDGTVERNRITLFEDRKEIADYYRNFLEQELHVNTSFRERIRKTSFGSRCLETRGYSLALVEFLKANFPEACCKGTAKHLPARIAGGSTQIVAAFLRGLFDAEGSVTASRGISLSMANEKLVRQVQLLLLRFGIVTSVLNKKSRYSPQYSICIGGKSELEVFSQEIDFTSSQKAAILQKLVKEKANTTASFINHLPLNGKMALKLFKAAGLSAEEQYRYGMFFRNKRLLSKNHFQKLLDKLPQGALEKSHELNAYLNTQANVARVESVEKVNTPATFYDLEVPDHENFIANSMIVHNSAARFGRLREEGIEYFQERIGEAMFSFLDAKNFKGVLVGGPGPAKEGFLKAKPYNYQLKILGVVDTGYTDEYGLREVLEKSKDIIAEQESVQEKKLLDDFMREVSRDGLATYGYQKVRRAVENNQAKQVLVSEGTELYELKMVCSQCAKSKVIEHNSQVHEEPCDCGGKFKVESAKDGFTSLIGLAEEKGMTVTMVSQETPEGQQFNSTFHGIGAFLRYR